MYSLAKKLLFRLDAETAHALTMRALDATLRGPALTALKARSIIGGEGFRNCVSEPRGLGCGF
jgi:hypothetical protein